MLVCAQSEAWSSTEETSTRAPYSTTNTINSRAKTLKFQKWMYGKEEVKSKVDEQNAWLDVYL